MKYSLDKTVEADFGDVSASVKIQGSLGVNIKLELNYYVSLTQRCVEFKASPTVSASISISGKLAQKLKLQCVKQWQEL